MRDLTRNKPSFTRLSHSNSVHTDSAVGNHALQTKYSMANEEKSRISQTVSVKKVTPSEIAKMNNIQQPNRNPPNGDGRLSNSDSINRSSTINVIRVTRVPNRIQSDNDHLDIDEHDLSNTRPKKFDRVSITKLPRRESSKIQRPRSASLTSIEQFSMEMQPITNRVKRSATSINNRQPNKNNGVKVNRVPRRILSTRS